MSVDLFTYNPLAPAFLNGVADVGTPAGYVDRWDDIAVSFTLLANELRLGVDKIFFSSDVLIRGLWSSASGGQWNARFIDVDGRYTANTRMAGFMLTGFASVPKPLLHEWHVPLGKFIRIEIENEAAGVNEVQIHFVCVRRYKL